MENILYYDFSNICGRIKPLHGVNGGPATTNFTFNHIEEFRNAGIPYSRLHDVEGKYGGTYYVDIPNVFPDFNADPENPNSYDFDLTDLYIEKIYESGTEAFYRLGVTIENGPIKKRIFPPADYKKWAKICEGIIKHYTQGWADGYNYKMEYWEIWNEPDNNLDTKINPMWQASKEEYFKLYEVTSNYLKEKFPHLKIGGYASCGFYPVVKDEATAREQYFVDFFIDFLEYITSDEHKSPIDFFSWHIYSNKVENVIAFSEFCYKKLCEYGLSGVESILNEWNYCGTSALVKSMPAAAMIAGTFCELQKTPVSSAMYYDAMPSRVNYCGLFTYPEYGVAKPYYSFRMFNELYKLGKEIKSNCNYNGLYTCAATNGENHAILISFYEPFDLLKKSTLKFDTTGVIIGRNNDFTDTEKENTKQIITTLDINNLDITETYLAEYFLLDESNNMTLLKKEKIATTKINLEIKLHSVTLIKIIKQ